MFCLQQAVLGSRNSARVDNANNIIETIVDGERLQPLILNNRDFYVSEDRDILIMGGRWVGSQTRPLMNIFDPNIDPKIKIRMFGVDLPRRYWTPYL
jgi:hypothetical protein